MIDKSLTRRGQPCWYVRPDVGSLAVNDASMLKSDAFVVLKKFFRNHASYLDMLELLHESMFLTEVGQVWDTLAGYAEDPVAWSKQEFFSIAKYKTGQSTIFHPVVMALHYLRLATPLNVKQCRDITTPLHILFQIQDDFVDIFGHAVEHAEIGKDIKENKCSWVIITALTSCNEEDRSYLRNHYGTQNDDEAHKVLQILHSLPMVELFREEQEKWLGEARSKIEKLDESQGLRKSVFNTLVEWFAQYGHACLARPEV